MRYILDPTSPSGISLAPEPQRVVNRGGFAGSPDITRVLQPGTNITFTGNGSQQSPYVINSSGGAGGSGITRNISVVSSATNAGNTSSTDYVYLVSGSTTLTLPTAVGNTNRYSVTNIGINTITVATSSSQTINGSSTATLPIANMSLDFVSDGSNWVVE